MGPFGQFPAGPGQVIFEVFDLQIPDLDRVVVLVPRHPIRNRRRRPPFLHLQPVDDRPAPGDPGTDPPTIGIV